MADINKMDRTWLCSVVFMDIVNYSSQSVDTQMKWKQRFNGYLMEAIQNVPESERVILDTGDGAAICFLGAPEAAMFAALQLCNSFVQDERQNQPGLCVRLGINLGPVKLVKDINGALNAIGDGINAGQRIMSFAADNKILVSQSFFEVVSRLSDDYKRMFQLKGVEKDKHIREHTVYHLLPPGTEKREQVLENAEGQAFPPTPERAIRVEAGPDPRAPQNRSMVWMVGGVGALVVLAALGAWRFFGSAAPPKPSTNAAPVAQSQASAPIPAPVAKVIEPTPEPPREKMPKAKAAPAPALPPPSKRESAAAPASAKAQAFYDQASRLLEEDKPDEAVRRFDDAIRASPDYVDAYVGRAEARRRLVQYELSLEDCNKIIRIKADDPRGYNCRGFARQLLKQYKQALPDFNEAIRLNPSFALAYDNRGSAYSGLQQYDRALQDYNQAIRLKPANALFHLKRAAAYLSLKQYDKAIQDYTQVIRAEPNNLKAYKERASAEEASGDKAGAAADLRRVQELRKDSRN
jgi:tetratricopeptide (TPR) repeat protein/class 3 adenylate cyclase